ncbi:type II toxin-antitoxin system RelE/ParE family toxin [Variibacter gotjawalensis]
MSWYQANAAEVVPQLTNALDTALKRIAENPKQFQVSAFSTRRALLRKFPYSVIFRETAHEVVVVAVYHMSRNPKALRRR